MPRHASPKVMLALFALAGALGAGACGPRPTGSGARTLGHDVGNPGNPLDILIDEARDVAATMIIGLGPLPADVDAGVRDFLTRNARALASDVLLSPHVFTNDALPNCALTNVPPVMSSILFSRPTCEGL